MKSALKFALTHTYSCRLRLTPKCLFFPSKFEFFVKYQSASTLESKACVTELQFSLVQQTRLSGLRVCAAAQKTEAGKQEGGSDVSERRGGKKK